MSKDAPKSEGMTHTEMKIGPIRKDPDPAKSGQAEEVPMKGAEKLASRPGALEIGSK
jgi:hypothetical protein